MKSLINEDKKMLMIQLTYKCNLNCIHCAYGDISNNELETMDLSEFEYYVNRYSGDYDVLKISGGEPTILMNINDYIDIGLKNFDEVVLYTNALNITKTKPTKYLISFYGNVFHPKIIVSDSNLDNVYLWRKIRANILYLKDEGYDVTLNSPIFSEKQIYDAVSFAYAYDLPLRIVRMQKHGKASDIDVLSIDEQMKIARRLESQFDNVYSTCSLLGEPRCDKKLTIKPNGDKIRCTAEVRGLNCSRAVRKVK